MSERRFTVGDVLKHKQERNTVEALLIPADSSQGATLHRIPKGEGQLDAIRELLGEDVQTVEHIAELRGGDVWGDEEAKLKSYPNPDIPPGVAADLREEYAAEKGIPSRVDGIENERATTMVYGDKEEARQRGEQQMAEYKAAGFFVIDASTGDPREPFIAGNVVLVSRS